MRAYFFYAERIDGTEYTSGIVTSSISPLLDNIGFFSDVLEQIAGSFIPVCKKEEIIIKSLSVMTLK